VPGSDPAHWLLRLTSAEWLAAADAELAHARGAVERRAVRPAVTHARRAAGMAWNAVLIARPDPKAGRSYMEHVVALTDDAALPALVREAARRLRDTPPRPPELIRLGPPDDGSVRDAQVIVNHARRLLGEH
jgi:HEPN domain-containing protein